MQQSKNTMMRDQSRRTGSRGGFSLVELTVAMIVLGIALSSITASMLSSMALSHVNRETGLASQAARRQMEIISASVRGSSVPSAYGALSANPNFAVTGLTPIAGDIDGMSGQIQFPTTTVLGAVQLREDVDDPSLGMPRDLDGLNGIDTADHSADAEVLPVRVRIEWRSGAGGTRSLDLETVLVAR
ncbi:MAG: prepilin-type N-terminal cleavage/methylation domain-containing protein [Planctomycetota bacterium]|jgi:prepilin-type N-terminal cleavage/methylation domain-containing protein